MNPFVIAWLGKNKTFIMSQRHCEGYDFQCRTEFLNGFVVGIQAKGYNTAITVAHLFFRNLVSGIAA